MKKKSVERQIVEFIFDGDTVEKVFVLWIWCCGYICLVTGYFLELITRVMLPYVVYKIVMHFLRKTILKEETKQEL